MGANLASLLNNAIDAIDESSSDERSRAAVVDEMASSADIDASTVNQILSGGIECPPRQRLRGFASVSGIPSERSQVSAAREDGCSYDDNSRTGRQRLRCHRLSPKFAFDGARLCFTKCQKDDEASETVFNVSGVIGDSWEGLSSQQMVPEIMNTKGDIRLRLNTPGGFVNDALDVYDALMSHPHKVTGDIVAEAWSAGTILCAGCDEVRIAPAAKYGVHRAWGGALNIGNSEELQQQMNQMSAYIKSLEKLDIEIARMIADRTGHKLKQVHEWMIGPDGVDGTEFIGQEAVEAGLVDSIIERKDKAIVNIYQMRAVAQRQALELLGKRAGYHSLDDWTQKTP